MPRFYAGVALIVAALLGLPAPVRAQCLLTSGWEPYYAPYSFHGADGVPTGVDIELIRLIAAEVGCVVRFRELPWARILVEVEQGVVDIASSASMTPERAAFALFSAPYRRTDMGLYARRGEADRYPLRGLADVLDRGLRLGYIVGYYYGAEFERLQSHPRFAELADPAVDYANNIRKLINGRIDLYLVEDVGVMGAQLQALGLAEAVQRHPLSLSGEALHFILSRKTIDAARLAAIDGAIERLRGDGRLDAVFQRFIK